MYVKVCTATATHGTLSGDSTLQCSRPHFSITQQQDHARGNMTFVLDDGGERAQPELVVLLVVSQELVRGAGLQLRRHLTQHRVDETN
jgi:hypothetical protein